MEECVPILLAVLSLPNGQWSEIDGVDRTTVHTTQTMKTAQIIRDVDAGAGACQVVIRAFSGALSALNALVSVDGEFGILGDLNIFYDAVLESLKRAGWLGDIYVCLWMKQFLGVMVQLLIDLIFEEHHRLILVGCSAATGRDSARWGFEALCGKYFVGITYCICKVVYSACGESSIRCEIKDRTSLDTGQESWYNPMEYIRVCELVYRESEPHNAVVKVEGEDLVHILNRMDACTVSGMLDTAVDLPRDQFCVPCAGEIKDNILHHVDAETLLCSMICCVALSMIQYCNGWGLDRCAINLTA